MDLPQSWEGIKEVGQTPGRKVTKLAGLDDLSVSQPQEAVISDLLSQGWDPSLLHYTSGQSLACVVSVSLSPAHETDSSFNFYSLVPNFTIFPKGYSLPLLSISSNPQGVEYTK